jgi:K+-transporting ATPase KdpF subunit
MGLLASSKDREALMNPWEILAGLLAVGLLVYLVAVLLHPEDFS